MGETFFAILLGHLAGDYLLQSKKMALQKTVKGWRGLSWCSWHCVLYTVSVCLFWRIFNPVIWLLVFLSHWPIDRWSLASRWLKLIGGRDILSAYQSGEEYREIDLVFSCLVYAVADSTLHLILLWGIILYF